MSSEKKAKGKLPLIRASEVGAYVYCRRAWWLRRVGGFEPHDPGGRFAQGTAAHAQHGRRLRSGQLQRQVAVILLALGLVLLVIALLFFRG